MDKLMKICSKCRKEKLIDEFNKDKYQKNGFTCWCKQCISEYHKEYSKINFKKIREKSKKWVEDNRERAREYSREYQRSNKRKRYMREYWKINAEKINKRQREKMKNPILKLNKNISYIIWKSLNDGKNGRHWENLVGYSLNELKNHLENLFQSGMTWENYGKNGWVIDHRIPISLFNITGVKNKGFKKCWELSNLQPMWEKENLEKYNKLFI